MTVIVLAAEPRF